MGHAYEATSTLQKELCQDLKTGDEGKTVFLSMHSPGNFAEEAAKLASLGFTLVGSPGTAKALRLRGVPIEDIPSSTASDWAPAAIELLKSGDVVFCINVPSSDKLNQMADEHFETTTARLQKPSRSGGIVHERAAALLESRSGAADRWVWRPRRLNERLPARSGACHTLPGN